MRLGHIPATTRGQDARVEREFAGIEVASGRQVWRGVLVGEPEMAGDDGANPVSYAGWSTVVILSR